MAACDMGKWDGMVTRWDTGTGTHGHGNLLVLLVACRWLGAHHLSVSSKLVSLQALVVCFIASFTVLASCPQDCNDCKKKNDGKND